MKMEQFIVENIVQDLELSGKPEGELIVEFENGCKLEYGNELTPTQVQKCPINVGWTADPNVLYTLAFVDPDAPSRANPVNGQCVHWLVVNIPGNSILDGDQYTEYIGSGAPKGTGLHRYVYLIFKQNGKISPNHPVASKFSREGRLKFKIANFVKEYSLSGPIAGNFYLAQFDDYVPILHEQLGFGK